jgi:predicted RNase H-like nuclease
MKFLGVDLAWTQTNESGLVALERDGTISDAGWAVGTTETLSWINRTSADDSLVFVDAPLIVSNPPGTQRLCENHASKRYGRWKAGANSTNLGMTQRLAGVDLRINLEQFGFRYDDGLDGPPTFGRVVSECYPYTTLVGAHELGYAHERPIYKRKPPSMTLRAFRPKRAITCDQLIGRIASLRHADPPVDIASHATTRQLLDEPSPMADDAYKHREDLVDAVLSAWTAALWWRWGTGRCQVLGDEADVIRPAATIIAPARPEQRVSALGTVRS